MGNTSARKEEIDLRPSMLLLVAIFWPQLYSRFRRAQVTQPLKAVILFDLIMSQMKEKLFDNSPTKR